MLCPRLALAVRWRWLLLLPVLLPPVLWGLVLGLMPTAWARDRVAAGLARATGRSVHLEELRLGVLGGVRLRGLELGEPGRQGPPWLRADLVGIDISLPQLLAGRLQPTAVEARGVTLRAERARGGTFPFHDLLRSRPRTSDRSHPSGTAAEEDIDVAFLLADLRLSLIDEPTGTRLECEHVGGRGIWHPHHASIKALSGRVNGGTFELEAEVERAPDGPMFEGRLVTQQVALGDGMPLLRFVVPVIPDSPHELQGRMDLDLYLRGQGGSTPELVRSLAGQGTIRLDPIALRNSPILDELARVLILPGAVRVGSIRSNFGVGQGRVVSHALTVEVGGLPIVLSGGTDFRGRFDYRVRSRAVSDTLAHRVKGLLPDLPLGVDDVVELHIQGDPEHQDVTVEGLRLDDAAGRPLSDREKLRELARRLRDRVFR